jgi:hypothetical protein
VYSLFSATSSINGILEKLGQKEGGAAMTLDQITQVLEELQCTTSTDDPEAFTFGKICFKCSVFFLCTIPMHESSVGKVLGMESVLAHRYDRHYMVVSQPCH